MGDEQENYSGLNEIIDSNRYIDPTHTMKAFSNLMGRIKALKSLTDNLDEQGIDVSIENDALIKLSIEMEMILQLLQPRFKEIFKLDFKIIKEHYPRMIKPVDESYYQHLFDEEINSANYKIALNHQKGSAYLEEETLILKESFINVLPNCSFSKLHQLLFQNKFISAKTNEESFIALSKLQAVRQADRIVWIEKYKGKNSQRTLLKLVKELFIQSLSRHVEPKPFSYLIPRYFVSDKGELPIGSIDTIWCNLQAENPDVIPKNKREITVLSLIQKASK